MKGNYVHRAFSHSQMIPKRRKKQIETVTKHNSNNQKYN